MGLIQGCSQALGGSRLSEVSADENMTEGVLGNASVAGERGRKVLAIASGGGHWVQLMRMMPAFAGQDLAFLTTLPGYRAQVGDARFYLVNDGNRWNKFGLLKMAAKVAMVLLRERPDVVISTGAAPGYFALRLAKLMGAQTIWVDSIANVDELSLCGEKVGRFADLWLTQWPHLARPAGPFFQGSVL